MLSYIKNQSMRTYIVFVVITSVTISQVILSLVWFTPIYIRENQIAIDVSRALGLQIASTVHFFKRLPTKYRHIVLDQLRDMGGTRFFVSLNEEQIAVTSISTSIKTKQLAEEINQTLSSRLGANLTKTIDFSDLETLHVLNNNTRIKDLPQSWIEGVLIHSPDNPPILVVQVKMDDEEWLYIAAVVPPPVANLSASYFPKTQWFLLLVLTGLLLLTMLYFIRWLTRPLKAVAVAAKRLGQNIYATPLKETGPTEVVAVAHAFNIMQQQIQTYIDDRNRLFSSISHDLKTPLTRIRLRIELYDDDEQKEAILRNVDELQYLVKGALTCIKDTELHEQATQIDIIHLLMQIQTDLYSTELLQIDTHTPISIIGKHQSLKRCFINIIDNAVKYGHRALVKPHIKDNNLFIDFTDEGPGIPTTQWLHVFQPYVRLQKIKEGHGLGLSIAKTIILAHNGDIQFVNQNAFTVRVRLPIESTLKSI